MSTNKTWNGTTYAVPDNREPKGWGADLSTFLKALADNALGKNTGTFTLAQDLDFGATYGVLAAYVKSKAGSPASAGIIRLGNTEEIKWRNAADSADLGLTVDDSDDLTFGGNVIRTKADTIPLSKGGTGQTTKAPAFNALSPASTKGDLILFDGSNNVRFALGTDGYALVADSAQSAGVKWATVMTNPMTTSGDMVEAGAGGSPTRKTKTDLLASASQIGFVSYFNEVDVDLSSDTGDFSSGTLKIRRIDDVVTISASTSVGHAASSLPSSDTNQIPSWAQPAHVQTLSYVNSSYIYQVAIGTGGSFYLYIQDSSHSSYGSKTSSDFPPISYNV